MPLQLYAIRKFYVLKTIKLRIYVPSVALFNS